MLPLPGAPNEEAVAAAAAKYALHELQGLSDSGIYSTLSLVEIESSSTSEGAFHEITRMQLKLSSPHFKSKKAAETFSVLVMSSKDNAESKSFAIDTFPEMEESAVESFWIAKVKKAKVGREKLYKELARKADESLESHSRIIQEAGKYTQGDGRKISELSNAELLKLIDDAKGEGDLAKVAKAVLSENYLLSSRTFVEATSEELLAMRDDPAVDPLRRTVAGRLYNEKMMQGTAAAVGVGGDEL